MANTKQPEPKYQVWKTLANGQKVSAEVKIPTRWNLSGKFALWASCFGCSYDEITAMYFADERAALVDFVGSVEKGKACAESGFAKIEGQVIPELTYFARPFKFRFEAPDQYGEIHHTLAIPDMSMEQKRGYITLQIDDEAPAVYLLQFEDAGTVGYAAMKNQYAVMGQLVNVSMDWKISDEKYPLFNLLGTIDKGMARLHIWCKAPEKKEKRNPDFLYVPFNTSHWRIQRAGSEVIRLLSQESAIVTAYFPTSGTVHYKTKENGIAEKVLTVRGNTLYSRITDDSYKSELDVTPAQLQAHFKPVNEIADLNPNDIKTDEHFWDTFGKTEMEGTMRWIIKQCQEAGSYQPIKCDLYHQDLCDEGLLTDFGDFNYLPTRKAIRILAGKGFHKSL